MGNPYEKLGDDAFWRTAVARRHPLSISGLWHPKHRLEPADKVATAGSCFAQHIGRALVARGFNWLDGEPAPEIFDHRTKKEFNYGLFSFRTGNIYTAAALRQWVRWAFERTNASGEFWQKGERFYDPFRPGVEPDGFASPDELFASRASTMRAIRSVLTEADCFVFTLGLTEGWINRGSGAVYAMCPGTVAGEFDPAVHEFRNFGFEAVRAELNEAFDFVRSINRGIRFLLTVSPVPLTATASGEHVLTATTYSKSVLRAVAGQLAHEREDTDYFPSYEIIASAPFRAMFYEPNMRSVASQGVDFVMDSFFTCLEEAYGPSVSRKRASAALRESREARRRRAQREVVCEEEMLEAFGGER